MSLLFSKSVSSLKSAPKRLPSQVDTKMQSKIEQQYKKIQSAQLNVKQKIDSFKQSILMYNNTLQTLNDKNKTPSVVDKIDKRKDHIKKLMTNISKLNKVYIKLQSHIEYLEGVKSLGKYRNDNYGGLKRKSTKLISEYKNVIKKVNTSIKSKKSKKSNKTKKRSKPKKTHRRSRRN